MRVSVKGIRDTKNRGSALTQIQVPAPQANGRNAEKEPKTEK